MKKLETSKVEMLSQFANFFDKNESVLIFYGKESVDLCNKELGKMSNGREFGSFKNKSEDGSLLSMTRSIWISGVSFIFIDMDDLEKFAKKIVEDCEK